MEGNKGGGLGIFSVLTIVFVVLKLVGVINWSWLWVLSPLWIGLILFIVVALLVLMATEMSDRLK